MLTKYIYHGEKLKINHFLLINFILSLLLVSLNCSKQRHDKYFSTAKPESVGINSDSLKVISDYVNQCVTDNRIVGAELLIIKSKTIILHEAYGLRNLEQNLPLQKNTLFSIASLTKPIIVTAIFMLYDQGKIALTDKVMKYIPSFDNSKCCNITIDQLLQNTAGFSNSLSVYDFKNAKELTDTLAIIGPDHKPGSNFSYHNTNATILGYIITLITGTSLENFIQKNIFNPLEMDCSFFNTAFPIESINHSRLSKGYKLNLDNNQFHEDWDLLKIKKPNYFPGCNGLYSTVIDYAHFLCMWMDWGKYRNIKFLEPSTIKLALTPNSYNPTYARHWDIFPSPEIVFNNDELLPEFGHIGGSGVIAYTIPQENLIVLYFTQSRWNKTIGDFRTLVKRVLY
jgi:CubicO group peptidase (beta-lactamase class C family)